MKVLLIALFGCFMSLTVHSQSFVKADESESKTLYRFENAFFVFNQPVKTDHVYKALFEKNFINPEELKKVSINRSQVTVPDDQQKLSNTGLAVITIEFVEIVKLSANKYRIALQYIQGNTSPHYYCLEVEGSGEPSTAEFYETAKRLSGAYCGDTY